MLRKLVYGSWFIVHGLLIIPSAYAVSHLGAPPARLADFENLFARVISLFVGLAFIALLAVLVWTGIRYLTSGGEPKALQSASQSLTWALLGMLFLVIAWLILQLIEAFTGVKVTIFQLRTLCDVTGRCPL